MIYFDSIEVRIRGGERVRVSRRWLTHPQRAGIGL